MGKNIYFDKERITKKWGDTMCRKLRELNGLSAEELLKKVGQFGIVPIDIAQICYDLGIHVKMTDFSAIEQKIYEITKEKREILGAVLAKDNDLAILYRNNTVNRKRFTLAHELAHCCLHIEPQRKLHLEFRTDGVSSDIKEIEANKFAGELLIPESSLKEVIDFSFDIEESKINFLAQLFVVSENVMKARLKELNISIINRE